MIFMILFKNGTTEGINARRFILKENERVIHVWSDDFREISLDRVERILLNGVLIYADESED